MESEKYLKITLIRSKIGQVPKNRATADALGLHKIRQSRVHKDSPGVRGMIQKIRHMITVEEVQAP